MDLRRATEILQAAAQDKARFKWLAAPPSRGNLTVADVHRAEDAPAPVRQVRAWAEAAWAAWAAHHDTIRAWLSESRGLRSDAR